MEVAEAKRVESAPAAARAASTNEAPVSETAATVGVLLAGHGVGSLTGGPAQQALLALQRSAGNRAVATLAGSTPTVQRSGPRPPIATAVGLSAGTGKPSISGTTHTEALDASRTKIVAPQTMFAPTTVEIPTGVSIGPENSIFVGVMQTLMGSSRNAQYRSPGAPVGDPPIVRHESLGQSRDALASMGGDRKIIPRPGASAPFYEPPESLGDLKRDARISFAESSDGLNPTPDLMDRPGWPAALSIGNSEFSPRLVSTSGSDNFLTSIAAKYTDAPELAHLNQVQWAVPWDMQIDDFGSGTGSAGKVIGSNIPPPETAGDIAVVKAAAGGVKDWLEFPTFGDAMLCPVGALLANLPLAKDNDPQSYGFTLDALIAKNPAFAGTVTVTKKMRGVGKEKLSLAISTSAMTFNPYGSELDEGGVASFNFNLNTLFNRDTLAAAGSITFAITVVPVFGADKSGSTSMPFPYLPVNTTVAIAGGSYEVNVKCKG